MPLREFDSVKVGDTLPEKVIPLTRQDLVNYAGVSGDLNPIHWDDDIAKQVGLDTAIAHGMLTMGLTGRALTDWVGDGRLLEYGVRFTAQVWPGDTLTVTATVREVGSRDEVPVATIDIVTSNSRGETVVTGTAVARLEP